MVKYWKIGIRERNLEELCKAISLYIQLVVDTENVLRKMDVERFDCYSSCRLCLVNGFKTRVSYQRCPDCILFEMNGRSERDSCVTAVRRVLSSALYAGNIPVIKFMAEARLHELIDYGYDRDHLREYLANRAPLIE